MPGIVAENLSRQASALHRKAQDLAVGVRDG